ncbi:MAG: transporter associated domain-containing protein [Pirellulaceae bacterium]
MPVSFPESDEYDTVGGLLMAMARSVPEVGERLEHAGVRFEVLERASPGAQGPQADCRDEDEDSRDRHRSPARRPVPGADGAGSGDSTSRSGRRLRNPEKTEGMVVVGRRVQRDKLRRLVVHATSVEQHRRRSVP